MRSRALLAAVASLFAACQFQASCGTKNLRMDRAKEFIASSLEREVGEKPSAVTCPDKIKVAKAISFECTAAYGPVTAKITLEQTSDEGTVVVKQVTGLLISRKLEAALAEQIAKQVGTGATADCGPRVRAAVPGDTFSCTARDAKGTTGTFVVTVNNAEGNVSFAPAGAPP